MNNALRTLLSTELVRFLTVAAVGLAIDISVGSTLIIGFGVPDIPASAVGLFCGMLWNYFMHLRWTFETSSTASIGHFATFALGVSVTLAIRSSALWMIERLGWQESLAPPVRLLMVAALAFLISYAINRRLVFKPKRG